MAKWPPTMIQDIVRYFTKNEAFIGGLSLTDRIMSDYKEQKAYSYFSSEFIFEILYNTVSDLSNYCMLKSKCTPSQRIRDIPHDMWVIIKMYNF
jgi:hypothetical protein